MNTVIVHKTMAVGKHKGKRRYTINREKSAHIHTSVVVENISKATTFSPADIELLLSSVAEVVMEKVAAGCSVSLGEIGTIRPTITARSVESRNLCNAKTITNRGIRLIGSPKLNRRLRNMPLRVTNSATRKNTKKEDVK